MSARAFPMGQAVRLASMALMLGLAGCAADQGGGLAIAVPAEAPRPVERPTDRDHERLVAAFGGEARAPRAVPLLNEITGRLVAATDRPAEAYRITVLDSALVNAFALPSGRLYVTRGLLALANDTSEIAAVLAHEIAHVTVRHASARLELEARNALVSRVVTGVLGDTAGGALVETRAKVSLASFSRGQELEADEIGVATLARAGFDPYGASRFLRSLGRASGRPGEGSSGDILATHPTTPERVALAIQAARRVGAPGLGEADRTRYLSAIDGIAYGDDPAGGVVRGRTFVHPRLDITFEAPEGITLENTPQAVIGASADGGRRFLFDVLDPKPGQGLEATLRESWSEAIEPGSLETLSLAGGPAAAATSRGEEWTFRVGVIRVGRSTFRLVAAARGPASDLDRAFRDALASLRPASAEDRRQLRPQRLQVIAAGPGDDVARLAARMGGDAERFATLNGLEGGAPLKAGERYKIVAD